MRIWGGLGRGIEAIVCNFLPRSCFVLRAGDTIGVGIRVVGGRR
jgi:hypothetical protein